MRLNQFFITVLAYLCSTVSCFNTVVVTGASGYLGREIVNSLLSDDDFAGSEIRCLVRDSRIQQEVSYWELVDQTTSRVKVYGYDMLDGGLSLKNALVDSGDSTCIFHVASVFTPDDDHTQMALDNVKGVEDCMIAVSESCPNGRIILTSSMAAVRCSNQAPTNGKYYTYEDWNNGSRLGANWGSSYQWSKAYSEKRAWEISKERNIAFTSLNPSFIFGPPSFAHASDSFSISTVSDWLSGKTPVQSRLCVDVRDVARAHVLAAKESKTIGERIIISRETRVPSVVMAEKMRQIAIDIGIGDPDKIHADTVFDGGIMKIGQKEVDCYERMNVFLNGFSPRSIETTISDMAKVLLELESNTIHK